MLPPDQTWIVDGFVANRKNLERSRTGEPGNPKTPDPPSSSTKPNAVIAPNPTISIETAIPGPSTAVRPPVPLATPTPPTPLPLPQPKDESSTGPAVATATTAQSSSVYHAMTNKIGRVRSTNSAEAEASTSSDAPGIRPALSLPARPPSVDPDRLLRRSNTLW